MVKCKRIRKMLADYANDVLESEDSYLVQEHVASCDSCRRELDTLEKILKVIDDAEVEYPPASIWENFIPDLHIRIEREAALAFKNQHRQRLYFLPGWAALAVTVALIFVAFIMPKYYPSVTPARFQNAEKPEAMEDSSPLAVESSPENALVAGMISKALITEREIAELEKLKNFIQSEMVTNSYYQGYDVLTSMDAESRVTESDEEFIQFILESELAEYDESLVDPDSIDLGAM